MLNLSDLPPLLTVAETAKLLRLKTKGVYNIISEGRLPGAIRTNGRVLISRDRLVQHLRESSVPSVHDPEDDD